MSSTLTGGIWDKSFLAAQPGNGSLPEVRYVKVPVHETLWSTEMPSHELALEMIQACHSQGNSATGLSMFALCLAWVSHRLRVGDVITCPSHAGHQPAHRPPQVKSQVAFQVRQQSTDAVKMVQLDSHNTFVLCLFPSWKRAVLIPLHLG